MLRAFRCYLSGAWKAVNLLSWVLWNVRISEENLLLVGIIIGCDLSVDCWASYKEKFWLMSWQQHAPFKKHNLIWWFLFHQKATWNPTPFNSPPSSKNVGLLWHWQVKPFGKILSLCQVQKLILYIPCQIFFQFSKATYFKKFVEHKINFFYL